MAQSLLSPDFFVNKRIKKPAASHQNRRLKLHAIPFGVAWSLTYYPTFSAFSGPYHVFIHFMSYKKGVSTRPTVEKP
jgi:hypothetical protein